uniref:Codanin 1 n=1 Tax=Callorhinchus milii TaxID=7868 RepID=A0A4W3JP14_CALMI
MQGLLLLLNYIKIPLSLPSPPDCDVKDELLAYSSLRREFVPFLLNFLREQTNQLIPNGPSTPAKSSSAKGLRLSYHRDRSECNPSDRRTCNTVPPKGSRTQLFSETPNSSANSDVFFQSPSSSGSSYFSKSNGDSSSAASPESVCCDTPRQGERRSAQRVSLGQFIVTTSESQSQRRAKKKNMLGPGRQVTKDFVRSSNEEDNPNWSGNRRRRVDLLSSPAASQPSSQLNLNNLDEFPPVGAASIKTKPSRRINPTPVSAERSLSKPKICFTSTPLSQQSTSTYTAGAVREAFGAGLEGTVVSPANSLQEEREMLKIERSKLLQVTSTPYVSVPDDTTTPIKPPPCGRSVPISSDSQTVCADVSKVSYRNQLDILAQLYSACILENLVPNIFLELFFILQLLTSRGGASAVDDAEDEMKYSSEYFRSVHNCVYFAVRVLDKQLTIISHLDKGTLRLLAENDRLAMFSSSLHDQMIYAHKISTAKVSLALPSVIQPVPFEPETDNRSNFISDRAFQNFKKQRDIFYELLREWEDKHENPCWDFERALGLRISEMFFLDTFCDFFHPNILFHILSSLFLLQMCKGPVGTLAGGDNPDQDVLDMLGSDNLMKLKRLQERFVVPQSIGGPCPPPAFSGCQEFFRDFLLCAGSHQLNQHLSDGLCQQISELDSIAILNHESTERETDMDEQDEKEHFASVLMTVRLLAKFLGFLTFLPYRTGDRPTRDMQEAALPLRNQGVSVLNVYEILKRSLERQRTILTVPWVVEFLSMMDYVTPLLDYYHKVFTLLLHLYRYMILTSKQNRNCLNKLLILAVLGWLFQIPAVPEEMFFNEEQIDAIELTVSDQGLDFVPLVDQQLLYTCCPYLIELRKLLVSYVVGSGVKNGGFMRKITPTAAEPLVSTSALSQQRLQAELEEAFFHNHPPSLRKTVEFVAERVCSNCVKHIKASLVAELVKRATVMLCNGMKCEQPNLTMLLDSVTTELCEESREAVVKGRLFCSKKGPEAIRVLLPEETSASVSFGLQNPYLCTMDSLIKKEVKLCFDRLKKSQALLSSGTQEAPIESVSCLPGCEHNAPLPSQITNEFKELLCIALGPRRSDEVIEHRQIDNLFRRLSRTLQCRKYISPVIEHALARCTVELASLLDRASNHQLLRPSLNYLLSLWKDAFHVPLPLHLIFSEKNISYLIEQCWVELSFFIHGLAQHGLMKTEEMDQYWKKLLQCPLPKVSVVSWCTL